MVERVVVLSIPQLRQRNLSPGALASLAELARKGEVTECCPAFPSLPASAFASMLTGSRPSEHGIVGDAYFDRENHKVVCRPFADEALHGPRLWDEVKRIRPGAKTMAWLTPSLRGASVDLAAWVEPEAGLSTSPEGLAEELAGRFGDYPSPRVLPDGEPLRLQSASWILRSAGVVIAEQKPTLAIVRLPYLGQVARRYGPDSAQAGRAVLELENILKPFLARFGDETLVLAITESVSTPVIQPTYPNLVLRGLGMLELVPSPGGGSDIDTRESSAFALVDHQVCHIYINDASVAPTIASAFSSEEEGVEIVAGRLSKKRLGLDHPRSGDLVLISQPDTYFASNWWLTRSERPAQPRLGSGLALDIEIARDHIHGSLGAGPPNEEYMGVVVSSLRGILPANHAPMAATELVPIVLRALEPAKA